MNRRQLIAGLGLFAAPAIVRVTSIMPVRGIALSIEPLVRVMTVFVNADLPMRVEWLPLSEVHRRHPVLRAEGILVDETRSVLNHEFGDYRTLQVG